MEQLFQKITKYQQRIIALINSWILNLLCQKLIYAQPPHFLSIFADVKIPKQYFLCLFAIFSLFKKYLKKKHNCTVTSCLLSQGVAVLLLWFSQALKLIKRKYFGKIKQKQKTTMVLYSMFNLIWKSVFHKLNIWGYCFSKVKQYHQLKNTIRYP